MGKLTLTVSPEEYQSIITGLMELKAKESMELILQLVAQKNNQMTGEKDAKNIQQNSL